MNAALLSGAAAWADWVWAASWQTAVLVALIWVVDRGLRRWLWPQLRMALWLLVFVKLVLPPSLASPASVVGALSAAPAPGAVAGSPVGLPVGASAATFEAGGLFVVLLAVWSVVTTAIAIYALLRARRLHRDLRAAAVPTPTWLRRLARRAAAEIGLRRPPPVVVSAGVTGAAVVGVLRPRVVLPPSALRPRDRGQQAARGDLEHVLLHEFAHVKRRDPWVSATVMALRALFWFHPLVALAARRVAALREVCCDATVASALEGAGGARSAYRATVLRAAWELVDGRPARRPALAMAPAAAALAERLHALDAPPRARPVVRLAVTTVAVAATLGCVVPMASTAPDPVTASAEHALAAAASGEPGCMRARYAAMYLMSRHAETNTEGNRP